MINEQSKQKNNHDDDHPPHHQPPLRSSDGKVHTILSSKNSFSKYNLVGGFNQPTWEILYSQVGSFPQGSGGENMTNIWVATT